MAMRTVPTTPGAQIVWIGGIVSCLVMLFVSFTVGFVMLVVVLVGGVALRLLGVR
jgi:uncharacterized membrane protein